MFLTPLGIEIIDEALLVVRDMQVDGIDWRGGYAGFCIGYNCPR